MKKAADVSLTQIRQSNVMYLPVLDKEKSLMLNKVFPLNDQKVGEGESVEGGSPPLEWGYRGKSAPPVSVLKPIIV